MEYGLTPTSLALLPKCFTRRLGNSRVEASSNKVRSSEPDYTESYYSVPATADTSMYRTTGAYLRNVQNQINCDAFK